MLALLTRLIGGALTPLIDQLSAFGASLLRKLALFLVAGVCFAVVIVALTLAFGLWIASLAGPIIGVLAIAALYLAAGATAAILALKGSPAKGKPATDHASTAQTHSAADASRQRRTAQIDQFIAPLLAVFQGLGLRREQLSVLAGASIAKQLRPVPLVGLAIVAGFLVGRVWKGWATLMSADLVVALLSLLRVAQAPNDKAEDVTA